MIDERFSLLNFKNESKEKKRSDNISQLLENEIQTELHKILEPKMKEIIQDLNSMGHKLTLYYPSKPGDISYRDESSGTCMLRVSSDCVISVGFSDTVDE